MLVQKPVHEYFTIIDSNFQTKLPANNFFSIHSEADFSGLHTTAIKALWQEFTDYGFLFTVLQVLWLCGAKPGKCYSKQPSTQPGHRTDTGQRNQGIPRCMLYFR